MKIILLTYFNYNLNIIPIHLKCLNSINFPVYYMLIKIIKTESVGGGRTLLDG